MKFDLAFFFLVGVALLGAFYLLFNARYKMMNADEPIDAVAVLGIVDDVLGWTPPDGIHVSVMVCSCCQASVCVDDERTGRIAKLHMGTIGEARTLLASLKILAEEFVRSRPKSPLDVIAATAGAAASAEARFFAARRDLR